jgi:pathogenesis-related protein 1
MKHARWMLIVFLAFAANAPAQDEPAAFSGMLEAHNAWRRVVQVPPLHWSAEAAQHAQAWADRLAGEGCTARYDPDPARKDRYGENVLNAWASGPYQGWRRTPQEIVDRWGEEGRDYDLATNLCNAPAGKICGHYLQLTWQETQVVGCGRARCDKGEVWVCDYTPRGNLPGERPYGGKRPPAHVSLVDVPPDDGTAPGEMCYALGSEPQMSPVPVKEELR